MNKDRRKQIAALVARIETLKDLKENIRAEVDQIRDEEEEYRDGMPENLQQSERYAASDQACDYLAEAVDNLELIDFDEIVASLEEAAV